MMIHTEADIAELLVERGKMVLLLHRLIRADERIVAGERFPHAGAIANMAEEARKILGYDTDCNDPPCQGGNG